MLRSKVAQFSISLKLALSLFFLFFIILIIRSNFSVITNQTPPEPQTHTSLSTKSTASQELEQEEEEKQLPSSSSSCPETTSCSKAPASLANALVHYATMNITPQQTFEEISVTLRVLERKSPCNFLVFGLGHDSLMWAALNHGGRTVFLEEDEGWISQVTTRFPSLVSHHVTYDTKVHQADRLMALGSAEPCTAVADPRSSACQLALKSFPDEVYDTEWDLIMVDAPTGYHGNAPGRMSAIYTAGLMARNRRSPGDTDVFVHDVDRVVEDGFSKAFLCEGYLVEQVNRLRHFVLPSHRDRQGAPFCPPV